MTLPVYGPACVHAATAPVDGAQTWCSHCNQYCGGKNSAGQEIACAGCAGARASFTAAFSLQTLVEEFIAEADKLLGVRPRLLYTYADMAATSFNDAFAEANPDLWIAEYGVSAPSTGPWKTWRLWQHESGGGPGGGDADFYNGDKAALDAWFASFRVTPKPPPPPPAPAVPAWQHAILARLPELRNGSRDAGGQTEWVRQAQLLLDIVAVDSVVADGDFGALTEESVKKTQASRNIPQTGVTDLPTWQVLAAGEPGGVLPSSVAVGAVDKAGGGTYWVHRVQAYCEAHNVPTSVDGDFGPGTEAAVKAVQHAYGEPETGVVNETTWSILIAHAKP
jgi:peptidoglycan hydrolase-like protein with peptidoglycan-binding domain